MVLVGRLALYGPVAARLHEEILPVTALWTEGTRSGQALRVLGQAGEQTTLVELDEALRSASAPPKEIVDRLMAGAQRDLTDLRPILEERAKVAAESAKEDLVTIAAREAEALGGFLQRSATGSASRPRLGTRISSSWTSPMWASVDSGRRTGGTGRSASKPSKGNLSKSRKGLRSPMTSGPNA